MRYSGETEKASILFILPFEGRVKLDFQIKSVQCKYFRVAKYRQLKESSLLQNDNLNVKNRYH